MKNIGIILILLIIRVPTYSQTDSTIKCKIWRPESFCSVPDSITFPEIIKIDSIRIKYTTCEKIDKDDSVIGIWITFSKNDSSTLILDGGFINFNLIKKSDRKKLHPLAILWSNGYDNSGKRIFKYITSDFNYYDYKAKFLFQKKIDLILIFHNAAIGDKIIINHFVQTEIKE